MSSTGAYTRDELAAQTHVIFSNTIQAMKILVKQVPECGHVISPENEVCWIMGTRGDVCSLLSRAARRVEGDLFISPPCVCWSGLC